MAGDASSPVPGRFAQEAAAALVRARAALVMEHPFFGSLALRLRFCADPACADLWTDGRTLGFNPAFASAMPPRALEGALAHEVLHLALGHHLRRQSREETLWNRACDFVVNHVLQESGFTLPGGFAHNPAYAGLTADEVYEALTALQEGPTNHGARKSLAAQEAGESGGVGAQQGGGRSPGSAANARFGRDDPRQSRKGEKSEAAGNRAVARRGAGNRESGESFAGEVRDHPDARDPRDEAARREAEQSVDIAVSQALQRAAHMGSVPAGLTRLLGREWRPQLDWRALLRQFLEECARSDYTWITPNRRYVYQNIYLPSRRESCLENVALAVDCSGSVDEKALGMFCAELSTVLEAFDTTLTVLFHDTKVQKTCTFTRTDMPVRLSPVGGGGTDFRPVCRHIAEEGPHPACLIWFTDLECTRYPEEPEYPVLWMCSAPDPQPPPFGRVVSLVPRSGEMFS